MRLWWLGLSALFGSVMILAVSGVVLACTNSSGPCNACYYGVSAAMSNGACGSHSGQSAAPQNIGVYADEYVSGTNSQNSYGGGHVLNTLWEGTDNTSTLSYWVEAGYFNGDLSSSYTNYVGCYWADNRPTYGYYAHAVTNTAPGYNVGEWMPVEIKYNDNGS